VQAAARKLGYFPNEVARNLITGRSRIVGVVVNHFDNQFYPQLIELLCRRLQLLGYHVLTFVNKGDSTEDVVSAVLPYRVHGLVLVSIPLAAPLETVCAEYDIPIVTLNRRLRLSDPNRQIPAYAITSDNEECGRMAAQLFIERGYRRFGFIAGAEHSVTSQGRYQGFQEHLAECGIAPPKHVVGNFATDGARKATLELFSGPDAPDALFVANDYMALAVMDTLRFELGLKCPEEVGIVGFHDIAQASWPTYLLTTFRQDLDTMVDATVKILLRQDGHDVNKELMLSCSLIERASVKGGETQAAADR
jgi:DNA-binding LacI/PurR family transcriptional regulator